jgi:hypothetical protein
MDSLEEVTVKSDSFMKHVFNFDDNTKGELINIAQYSLLAIIPIIILNKTLQKVIPDIDEDKSSLEILAEVVSQVLIIFFGIYFIHRLVTFLPPYGGKPYGQLNMFNFMLGFLVIVMSLQTKLGEKVNILFERVMELWFGPQGTEQQQQPEQQKKNIVRVSQPISNQGSHQMASSRQLNQVDQVANYNTMMTQQQPEMPMQPSGVSQGSYEQSLGQRGGNVQQSPNFDGMFQEPMAANEAFLGYGSFY